MSHGSTPNTIRQHYPKSIAVEYHFSGFDQSSTGWIGPVSGWYSRSEEASGTWLELSTMNGRFEAESLIKGDLIEWPEIQCCESFS